MKISIRSKILLIFVLLISLVLLAQICFNSFFAKDYYMDYKYSTMSTAYNDLKSNFDGTTESVSNILAPYEAQHNINMILVHEKDLVYASFDKYFNRRGEQDLNITLTDEMMNFFKENNPFDTGGSPQPPRGEDLRFAETFTHDGKTYNIFMSLPVASIDDTVKVFTDSTMIISISALFFSLIFCFVLSNSISKPIEEIEIVAHKMSNLDFSSVVNEDLSSKELHGLAKSINTMSARLKSSIEDLSIANEKLKDDIDYQKQIEKMRREFIGNVSHEMKTPLALLEIYADNLKNIELDVDKDYYCETIIEEVQNLSDLVSSMLDISSIESGLSSLNFEQIDLSEVINYELAKMLPLLEGCNVKCNIAPDIFVSADEKYLTQAMKNYINNAKEHGKENGNIEITLETNGDNAIFSVYNDGENIPENELVHIWDSFYRSDKARVRSGKNVGLGLHIVSTVINKHNGTYSCVNMQNGVKFTFTLPLIDNSDANI